jgi:hypothetical protein
MNQDEKYREAKDIVRWHEQKLKQSSINCWSFNLNDKILVKLKEDGFQHWLDDFNKYLPDNLKASMKDLKNREDKDGYVEFQTWEFIKLFGETISMGSQPIFETTVRFYKEEIKPCV